MMIDDEQIIEPLAYDFGFSRRSFVQALGAGLLIFVAAPSDAIAQDRAGETEQRSRRSGFDRSRQPIPLSARLHIGKDGSITVLTGKVEGGQGARAEITQAAAEELRVPAERVTLLMADTELVPDDGITAGSRTTPSTIPAVRQACAAARELLEKLKSQNANPDYRDLAAAENFGDQMVPDNIAVTRVDDQKILGHPLPRPNARDIVVGTHKYPADITRPGMLYGKVLRAPSYGAKLTSVDLSAAKAMDGVVAVADGSFAAVAAPTTYLAKAALKAIEPTAKWDALPHPSSSELFDYLRKNAKGGVPENPHKDELASAAKTITATFRVPYVQHAPMEPRAAVAEWQDGKVTVWTSTQNPFGVRRELSQAFHVAPEKVRVIVPDFGGGFGGKHTGECAIEAARLAQAAGKPVAVRWTRVEEFTFAYFRPASLIDAQATLDNSGNITSWHWIDINYGSPGIQTPYRVGKDHTQSVETTPPLRHGSYRALAATANNFARESVMDELAHEAGKDPLEFRLSHLENPRLRAVLEEAAKRFDWPNRKREEKKLGCGLACATEKGSFVATCAEVAIDGAAIHVRRVVQAFECGAVMNPENLRSQTIGAIIMGLGPALREATAFENGRMLNASFWKYEVPRMKDVPPQIEVHLLDRPDLPSAGAGETPLITIAPAIANAVFHATGQRLRDMPLKLA